MELTMGGVGGGADTNTHKRKDIATYRLIEIFNRPGVAGAVLQSLIH